MQWIDGDVVGGDVGGEILRGPVDDGIDLHESAFLVPGGERRGCPLVRMLAPDAGVPALRALELAGPRPRCAPRPCGVAGGDRIVEAEPPMAGGESRDFARLRRDQADADAVADFGNL